MNKLLKYFKLGMQPILFAIIFVSLIFLPFVLVALLIELYKYAGILVTVGVGVVLFFIMVTLIGKLMSDE